MNAAMPPIAPHARLTFRVRCAAAICLAAWFAAVPALLPATFAAFGTLDRQHRVALEVRGGQTVVVFHHGGAAVASAHRHNALARVLTAFAQSESATPDHVLTFEQVDSAVALNISPGPGQALGTRSAESHLTLAAPISSTAPVCAPRPPPITAFALVCLRSTSLRI
jgi:hypothetical protein